MLKRQDSQLSSSSRLEVPVVDNRKTTNVGCVSTIFHLLTSKYQNRHKFLTLGKEHVKMSSEKCASKEKKAILVDNKQKLVAKNNVKNNFNKKKEEVINREANIYPRLSCEVPRSPVLPQEIRRPKSPEIFKPRSATLVARLMGLEEVECRTLKSDKGYDSGLPSCGSTSQKRRKLLGVLEKCDEDLKMLKKVLENVRSVQNIRTPALKEGSRKINNVDECRPIYEFTDQTHLASQAKRRNTGRMSLQNYTLTKKPGENDVVDLQFLDNLRTDKFQQRCKNSNAMIASINEVCHDVECGEKREIGRIGMVIQDYICRDLIEEIVVEFTCLSLIQYHLNHVREDFVSSCVVLIGIGTFRTSSY